MKNIRGFLFENFQFLEVKFSIYLNRRVFVMIIKFYCDAIQCLGTVAFRGCSFIVLSQSTVFLFLYRLSVC